MTIKLDISKAYDRVEWAFLRRIMLKIGLPKQWVNLAMETVCTTSYLMLFNREPKGFITQLEALSKVILYLLTYSFFALKGCLL